MERSRSFIAIPPGATIKEQLVDRGMNQKEFALRMGMSEKHISKLVNGEVQLTIDVARRLEMVLGLPAQFWCNLEAGYRETIAKVNEENAMDADIEIARKMPYSEMVQKGWIDDVTKWPQKVINLRRYFEVAQLTFLRDSLIPQIACRKLSVTEKSDFALIAWAQKARIVSREISVKPINIAKLKKNISEVKELAKAQTTDFRSQLGSLLADCGIAVVFLPYIKGSFLHGATFCDGNKIVVGLTEGNKDDDRLWFNLFHELAHIIYGHVGKAEGTTEDDEACADEYAKSQLI